MEIVELDKPADAWCDHCDVGKACKVYAGRPQSCRDFNCGYLFWEDHIGEHWFPAKSRMVIVSELEGKRIAVRVDPSRPDAWRQAPYYNEIRAWARNTRLPESRPDAFAVVVHIGAQWIFLLPDREVDLGVVTDDHVVASAEVLTAAGPRLEVFKLHKDDPRLAR